MVQETLKSNFAPKIHFLFNFSRMAKNAKNGGQDPVSRRVLGPKNARLWAKKFRNTIVGPKTTKMQHY